MKTETFLPVFKGFYGSIFEPDETNEIDYINELRAEKELPEIDYDDCKFNYSEYYKDVSICLVNEIAGELPGLQRQGQEFLLKQSALALDNRKLNVVEEQQKYQNEQAKEQQKIAQQNIIEQRTFRKEQAKIKERDYLLNSVTEPYQKQAIYNKYGMYDMAAQMQTQGDKEADQKTSL